MRDPLFAGGTRYGERKANSGATNDPTEISDCNIHM